MMKQQEGRLVSCIWKIVKNREGFGKTLAINFLYCVQNFENRIKCLKS